jgi:hypothetical protein
MGEGEITRPERDRVEIFDGRRIRSAENRVDLDGGPRLLERESSALRFGGERGRRSDLLDLYGRREAPARSPRSASARASTSVAHASFGTRSTSASASFATRAARGRPSGSAASASWIARRSTSG